MTEETDLLTEEETAEFRSTTGVPLYETAHPVKELQLIFVTRAVATIEALRQELDDARRVLVFADGLTVAETGRCLADPYAADYEPAHRALRGAGCGPVGVTDAGPGHLPGEKAR
jgi:hypothetical protein